MIKFYDTSSLLLQANDLLEEKDRIYISSITLEELENIKTSSNKDANVKYAARHLLRLFDDKQLELEIINFTINMLETIEQNSLSVTNDTKILATILSYAAQHNINLDDIIFITNDLALKNIAKMFFTNIQSVKEDNDTYCGFKEIKLEEEEMANLYSNLETNSLNLLVNEYALIKNSNNQIVDRLCWTGESYRSLNFKPFNSFWFGDIKPIKGDSYQMCAADSLINNQITMLRGSAGTGKSILALGYLMHLLEKGKINKVVIFCNTVATKNSAKLGFYPGSRDEKLLDSQIGNLLSSKLGDKFEVQRLIDNGLLILLPFSDIRGYDTTGMKAGVYISEAQNLDISLMKLALQRIGEDCICIIDGDDRAQVDDINFAGCNNGMKRLSKVFRGQDFYGEITLQNIHRSKIAKIAELM